MEETRLVIFDETTLADFHDLILPNVLSQLYGLDDFEQFGILALGAVRGEEFAGALIAQVLSDVNIQILSIYVAPEYRRSGIGSLLLDGIAARGYELFDSVEQYEVPVGICIDYALPDELLPGFEAFLGKAGFRHREERSALYAFPAENGARLSSGPETFELSEEYRQMLGEVLDDYEIKGEPALCACAGGLEDIRCIVFAADAGEGEYEIFSFTEDGCTDEEFASALKRVLGKLEPSATVFADSLRNICPQVLEKAVGPNGQRIRHCYAQRRLIVEKGAEA